MLRESNNPHDENAIEIFWNKYKLGHFPKQYNEIIAIMLDSIFKLYAKEESVNKEMPTWERINVGVYV